MTFLPAEHFAVLVHNLTEIEMRTALLAMGLLASTSLAQVENPAIGAALRAQVDGVQVTFDLYVENLGDVPLSGVFAELPLNPVLGAGNYSVPQQPVRISGPGSLVLSPQFFGFNVFSRVIVGGTLAAGERAQVRFRVDINTVSDQGNGFGVYLAAMTVSAQSPLGAMVFDTTDDGIVPDPDGDGDAGEAGENDQTRITVGDEARIGVAKSVAVNGSQVSFDYILENFGGSTMSSLSLPEDLDTVFGAGNYTLASAPALIVDPGTITLNTGFDGSADPELLGGPSSLGSGGLAQIRLVVDVVAISDQGFGFGAYRNQVLFTGTSPLGTLGIDLSDDGIEPDADSDGTGDGAGETDPSLFALTVIDVRIDGSSNLVIEDLAGTDDQLRISQSGGALTIEATGKTLVSVIAGVTGTGTSTLTVPLAGVSGQIIVTGGDGDDALEIDFSTGDLERTLVFQGGAQGLAGDRLAIAGGAPGAARVTATGSGAGIIALGANRIEFSGLE